MVKTESGQRETGETGKDLLLRGLHGKFSLEERKETSVDFDSFNSEERQLLKTEAQRWKEKHSKEEWEAVHNDVKRRIGLLIQSKTINNVNKKLINRDRS